MLLNKKNITLINVINFLICLLPISLIAGSLIVNINLSLFLILSIFYIRKNNLNLVLNYANIILICFFLFIIISSFLNIDSMPTNKPFIKSIFLLRFLLFYLVIEILLINSKLDIKKFFIFSLICAAFVSFDVLFQYIFGYDLFGYKPWEDKITGVFEHEAIAGSYIQKFSLFAIFGSLIIFENKKIKKQFLFLVILLLSIGVFVTNNRMPMISLFFSLIILLFLDKKIRSIVALSIISFLCITFIFISNDDNIKSRYKHIYDRFDRFYKSENFKIQNKKSLNSTQIENADNYVPNHIQIYRATIESWKNHKIIGGGRRSFRIECEKIVNQKKNLQCSTHPHNYQLEILHDTGIVGLILMSAFVLLKLFDLFKSYFISLRENRYNFYIVPILISFLIEIWPIKSTGSIFTTWNGTTVWILVALTSYKIIKKNN